MSLLMIIHLMNGHQYFYSILEPKLNSVMNSEVGAGGRHPRNPPPPPPLEQADVSAEDLRFCFFSDQRV